MTVESIPLWTLPANWRETVSERLQWLSPVLGSPSGAEQRFAVRNTPRRSLEASFVGVGESRAWLDNAIHAAGAARWYVPIWTDVGRMTAAFNAIFPTIIPVATTGREFRVGGFVIIWRDVFTASVHQIDAMTSSTLTVDPAITGSWPAGTLVMPVEVMRMPEAPSVERRTESVVETRLRFEVDGPAPYTAADLGTLYDGFPVLSLPPNETGDLTTVYNRLLAEFAPETSRRFIVDVAQRNFSVQQHRWFAKGRTEQNALRGFFYALQGRRQAVWVPTFATDFKLVLAAGSSATEITVERCGYVAFGGPRFGREHIRIELRDGTIINRLILSAVTALDGEELTLDSVLGVSITPATVKRISFMALMRLDQDAVEFVHHTDNEGMMTCSAAFRTAGEFRDAAAFVIPSFGDTVQGAGACGTPPSVSGFVTVLTTPGAGIYVVPAGVTSLKIECWGGGGAGGYRLSPGGSANGGGSGCWAQADALDVTPGQNLYYYIADSSPGIDGANTNAPDGETTWINKVSNEQPTLTTEGAYAAGGRGGNQSSAAGAAGSGAATDRLGNTTRAGSSSSSVIGATVASGGAGAPTPSGAASNSVGNTTPGTATAGSNAGSGGGAGGAADTDGGDDVDGGGGGGGGVTTGVAAGDGGAPGGGGGGGAFPASRSGAGARGQIRITYTP